jgi:hypothetical protein
MIEPSSGRTTTSGPGAPLLLGFVATGALVIAVLIGFQLGSGQERVRTVIVGGSGEPVASGDRGVEASGQPNGGRIQVPRVDNQLVQAYYGNLRQASWVVCSDAAALTCTPAKYASVDGSRGFAAPETYLDQVPSANVAGPARIYLAGNLEHVWLGAADVPQPQGWKRLLGVTLNGSVQFIDLGNLAPGNYVVMDRSQNAFNDRGPITRALTLRVKSTAG